MRGAVDALDVPVVSFNRQPVKPLAAVRIQQGYVRVCFLVAAEGKDKVSVFGNRIVFAVENDRFGIVLNRPAMISPCLKSPQSSTALAADGRVAANMLIVKQIAL